MINFKNVVNYDQIMNFLYEENIPITNLLISSYQEYIFNVKSSRSRKNIDKIMALYIEKGDFHSYVIENIGDIYLPYDKIIRKLNNIYKEYNDRKISTRWL